MSRTIAPWHHRLSVSLRVIGAVLGGYALSAALVALLAVALPRLVGWPRSEAVLLASMLGFLIYLGALVWAFSQRCASRIWGVFVVGTAAAALLLYLLQH